MVASQVRIGRCTANLGLAPKTVSTDLNFYSSSRGKRSAKMAQWHSGYCISVGHPSRDPAQVYSWHSRDPVKLAPVTDIFFSVGLVFFIFYQMLSDRQRFSAEVISVIK